MFSPKSEKKEETKWVLGFRVLGGGGSASKFQASTIQTPFPRQYNSKESLVSCQVVTPAFGKSLKTFTFFFFKFFFKDKKYKHEFTYPSSLGKNERMNE